MTVAPSQQVGYDISAELSDEFRGLLTDDTIRGSVREANLAASSTPIASPAIAE